jgi:hypothetical protein
MRRLGLVLLSYVPLRNTYFLTLGDAVLESEALNLWGHERGR